MAQNDVERGAMMQDGAERNGTPPDAAQRRAAPQADEAAELNAKGERLYGLLASYQSVAVAFSGGVDSSLLLDVAHEALGDNCLALTAYSASFPQRERAAAAAFCEQRGIAHDEVANEELEIEGFCTNPPNRCYLCKRSLFEKLLAVAAERGIAVVAEGSNHDDLGDYRPGLTAIAELGIASPLREVGLTKAEVRALARRRCLAVWNKPAFACLASRLPYNTPITSELLARIDAAEQFLLDVGLGQVRVRVHGDVARIETDARGDEALLSAQLRGAVNRRLQELGFAYVALDLGGYRSGSMNRGLSHPDT
ncbi:MAG: ATP-dependent sacrificial sulfur transferase LarE [Coriobacteriales bacterium]|nr:ATP-dependent sacrificial sulfur transferase LarE [Coriobacteriales bacterium]